MASQKAVRSLLRERPHPPAKLCTPNGGDLFCPAMEIDAWARQHIIRDDGAIHNAVHRHLNFARIGWLWTSVPNSKAGNDIVGTCEVPRCQGNKWLKARVDAQLDAWFGAVNLDFLITLYAPYCDAAEDAAFCQLCDHELGHAGQAKDDFKAPKFSPQTGLPMFAPRGHDLEGFVFEGERYGASNGPGKAAEYVRAVNLPPTVSAVKIALACGTCLG